MAFPYWDVCIQEYPDGRPPSAHNGCGVKTDIFAGQVTILV
jgi:hypothetical protein